MTNIMYTRKKKKLYIHLYKYTAKLDSIWRHKYTVNLQHCLTKQKLIYDLTVSKCAIQIYIVHYSYTRFCTHKLIQIKINISLHHHTTSLLFGIHVSHSLFFLFNVLHSAFHIFHSQYMFNNFTFCFWKHLLSEIL